MKSNNNLVSILVNPFNMIAGSKSLMLGMVIIFTTSFFAYLFDTHFTGVLDVKYGQSGLKYYNFLLYNIINLITISLLIYLSGLIISKSSIRFIDVIGTQSLARFPLIITPFFNSGSLMEKFGLLIMQKYLSNSNEVEIFVYQWILIICFLFLIVIAIIWMIALMYNAYRVSCNVKGNIAIISFILSLLFAEAFSLFLNYFFKL